MSTKSNGGWGFNGSVKSESGSSSTYGFLGEEERRKFGCSTRSGRLDLHGTRMPRLRLRNLSARELCTVLLLRPDTFGKYTSPWFFFSPPSHSIDQLGDDEETGTYDNLPELVRSFVDLCTIN